MNATAVAVSEIPAQFTTLAISELHESKTNPRRHFAGLDDLTASVKQHGVLTPLLVRADGRSGYEIIAGARRYRAAKAAKLEQLPVRVLELDDAQALEFQVIENLQREDVHPLDEALGYQALLKDGKYDVPAIAAKVSKSESYVYQRLKLAALIPEAQKAFFDEKITAGHAILIARLQPKQQKDALQEMKYERSVRDLAEWIHRNVHLNLAEAAFPKDDAELVPSAKACVDCPKRTGANPLLFPDVKKADTCTDPGCFHAKEAAFVERQLKAHPDAERLSVGYFYGKHKPKGLTDWDNAGSKKCKDTARGIVVQVQSHYGDRGRLGQLVNICTNKRCRVHHDYVPSESRKPSKTEAKRFAERRFQSAVEDALFPAIVEAAAKEKSVNLEDLRYLALNLKEYAYYDRLMSLAKALGLKNDSDAQFRQAIAKFTAPQLVALCLGVVLAEQESELRPAAKRHGVDVKAIEKQVREAGAAKSKVQTSARKRKK